MSHPQDPHQKKGLSGFAIAGIGCGGLLLAAFLGGGFLVAKISSKVKEVAADPGKAAGNAAAWALEMNPDIEVLKKDEAKREITFKNKTTGEVSTLSFEEVAKGKLTVRNDKGQEYGVDASKAQTEGVVVKGPDGQIVTAGGAAASEPPAEVPKFPGLVPLGGGYRAEMAGGTGGLTMGLADGSIVQAKEHYERELKAQGYEVTATVNGDNESASVTGQMPDGKSSIYVIITPDQSNPGKVQINTRYQLEKK